MTWPLCECGCGQPVKGDVRTGRPTRYATREHSRRAARTKRMPGKVRRCFTCNVIKSYSAFDDSAAKRCKTCKHKAAIQLCEICGEPAGVSARGRSRTFCTKPECRSAWFSKQRKIWTTKQAKKLAARKVKRCPNCDRAKPLTQEFWSTRAPISDGPIKWEAYCKPCKAALTRDRIHNNPEKRADRLAKQKLRRDEVRARRDADPVFDEQLRQLHREQNRRSRQKRAEREAEEAPRHYAGGKEIPAFPLAVFIDREAQREKKRLNGHAPDQEETLEGVCLKLGVDSRRVRDWRLKPNASVRLDLVDRVLINAGALWFDVYDDELFPVEHRLAAMAFEGAPA